MQPFWSPAAPEAMAVRQPELILSPFKKESFSMPAIIIANLCGYYYSEDGYEREATKLTEYGFELMRSRRGDDARYTEHWYLFGEYAAQGELRQLIEGLDRQMPADEKTDKVVQFLCRKCRFGTLDLVTQRAAMIMD